MQIYLCANIARLEQNMFKFNDVYLQCTFFSLAETYENWEKLAQTRSHPTRLTCSCTWDKWTVESNCWVWGKDLCAGKMMRDQDKKYSSKYVSQIAKRLVCQKDVLVTCWIVLSRSRSAFWAKSLSRDSASFLSHPHWELCHNSCIEKNILTGCPGDNSKSAGWPEPVIPRFPEGCQHARMASYNWKVGCVSLWLGIFHFCHIITAVWWP